MIFIYPAVFHETKEKTYEGYFPDLECCYAKGETLDDAIEDAIDAAYNWLTLELDEDDCQLPNVSDEADMDLKEGDIVRDIMVHVRFHTGWDE